MNFYKLSKAMNEASYDSGVAPSSTGVPAQGATGTSQRINMPQANMPQQQVNTQQNTQEPVDNNETPDAQHIKGLLQRINTKLGNKMNKYNGLVNVLKTKPVLLDLFSQALEDVGSMQGSAFNQLSQR